MATKFVWFPHDTVFTSISVKFKYAKKTIVLRKNKAHSLLKITQPLPSNQPVINNVSFKFQSTNYEPPVHFISRLYQDYIDLLTTNSRSIYSTAAEDQMFAVPKPAVQHCPHV